MKETVAAVSTCGVGLLGPALRFDAIRFGGAQSGLRTGALWLRICAVGTGFTWVDGDAAGLSGSRSMDVPSADGSDRRLALALERFASDCVLEISTALAGLWRDRPKPLYGGPRGLSTPGLTGDEGNAKRLRRAMRVSGLLGAPSLVPPGAMDLFFNGSFLPLPP